MKNVGYIYLPVKKAEDKKIPHREIVECILTAIGAVGMTTGFYIGYCVLWAISKSN